LFLGFWNSQDKPMVAEQMRSEAEIIKARESFIATGEDPPAMNAAVRDTLAWVLGRFGIEELMDEYLVVGDAECFTCPRGWYNA
jgi:hypothetical protein